jgi:MFS family permease
MSNTQSILQLTAPDHLRGRVLSLFLLAFGGLAPFGGLLAGWLADVGGTQLAFTVGGISGLLMTAYGIHAMRRGSFAPAVVPAPAAGLSGETARAA